MRACNLGIAAQIVNMGVPLLVLQVYTLFFWLPLEYKIIRSIIEKEFKDLKD
jgi:hypothetical protein